jgi:hypothetical protein
MFLVILAESAKRGWIDRYADAGGLTYDRRMALAWAFVRSKIGNGAVSGIQSGTRCSNEAAYYETLPRTFEKASPGVGWVLKAALAMEAGLVYQNPLSTPHDLAGFVAEGPVAMSFDSGTLELASSAATKAPSSNIVLWCPVQLPSWQGGVSIEWEFMPLEATGLAMLFFSARGLRGEDMFDPSLPARTGLFDDYRKGAINGGQLSYYRRSKPSEWTDPVINLKVMNGNVMLAQCADPISTRPEWHRIRVVLSDARAKVFVDGELVIQWQGNLSDHGLFADHGRIGFRHMFPLRARYRNLTVKAGVL